MSRETRRAKRERARFVEEQIAQARAEGFEPISPADLRVISLALEDREAKYAGQPAGEAAARVRRKIDRNVIR